MSLPALISRMTHGPAEVLGIKDYTLAEGNVADLVVTDPDATYTIDASHFLSKARNTPFNGRKVTGRVVMTIVEGKIVYAL